LVTNKVRFGSTNVLNKVRFGSTNVLNKVRFGYFYSAFK
jgi:hypothetical protein